MIEGERRRNRKVVREGHLEEAKVMWGERAPKENCALVVKSK